MSSLSTSLINGISNFTPGAFKLFLFPKTPPFTILHVTPSSSTDITSIFIKPFSNKTIEPTSKLSIACGWLTENLSDVPKTVSFTILIVFPSSSFISSFSIIPLLNSGPFVSYNIATFFPVISLTLCTDATTAALSSIVACEKFIRATFIPASTILLITSGSVLAGPILQIIFVFLILVLQLIFYISLINFFT